MHQSNDTDFSFQLKHGITILILSHNLHKEFFYLQFHCAITMRVIILDYDDTLFPSSHVAQHNLYQTPLNSTSFAHHRDAFLQLEVAAIALLTKAIAIGDLVVIVTNGKLDWIKYSMKMFYHQFFDFVRKNETPIVSAQDIFVQSTPHPVMWKVSDCSYTFSLYDEVLLKLLFTPCTLHCSVSIFVR